DEGQTMKPHILLRTTTRTLVVDYLRSQILSGDLAPGERLNLKKLASALNVSVTPIREALNQIAVDGLVKLDPFRGAFVSELGAEEYEEVYLMRAGLEGLAHRLGARHIGPEGIAIARRCLEHMEKTNARGDISKFVEHDRNFHQVIFQASGRAALSERIMSLRRSAERYTRAAYLLPEGGAKDTIRTHWQILEACE